MLRHSQYCHVMKGSIYKFLFLLVLIVFTVSPIVDAYQDSYYSSAVFYNDIYDSDSPVSIDDLKLDYALSSLHASALASNRNHDNQVLMMHALAADVAACHIIARNLSFRAHKSSQICSLLSSDPSPPTI